MLRILALVCSLMPLAQASFFGGGGGGCGCQAPPPCPPPPPPCLPQPCLPQLPPIQIPSICLPPLPRLQLPCPPPPCGCGCGRKKRSEPSSVVSRHHEDADANLCNNPQIRKIILQNITEDPLNSKVAIHSELKAKLHGNYIVMCSSGAFSFVADTHNYCVEGTDTNSCYVFEA